MPVFVQVYPVIVILTLSEAEGEESLYFSRSTVDTTGKIQGSVRSAQDDGHFNDYSFAGKCSRESVLTELPLAPHRSVILSEASRGFIARCAVEGSAFGIVARANKPQILRLRADALRSG
jgi:hypothetical protein